SLGIHQACSFVPSEEVNEYLGQAKCEDANRPRADLGSLGKISNGIRIPGQVPTPRHSQRELRLGALKLSCGNATETLVTHPLAGWICAPPIIERERYASFTSQSTVAKRDLSVTASDKACFTSNERRSLGGITATRRTAESSITTEVRR